MNSPGRPHPPGSGDSVRRSAARPSDTVVGAGNAPGSGDSVRRNAVRPNDTVGGAGNAPGSGDSVRRGSVRPNDTVGAGNAFGNGGGVDAGGSEIKQIIPGYRLEKKIGQGGMGAVFLACQLSMDRKVAVKILPRSMTAKPDFRERFQREARAAGALNHPNIVSAIDCQEAGGYCYLVMEYVDGYDPLREVKNRDGGPLPEKKAAAIGLQIAQALAHAWRAGIVHRDVKPENFLVTADGEAKLCDLGIAQFTSHGDEEGGAGGVGVAIGTPRYMSPEQAQGLANIDFRTDIYSLGASLYHLMTGQPPFTGANNAEVMRGHVNSALPPPQEVNPQLSRNAARVLEKMLAKKPADRYASAEALIADLDAIAKGRIPPGVLPGVAAGATGSKGKAPGRARAGGAGDAGGPGGGGDGAGGFSPLLVVLSAVAACALIYFFVLREPPETVDKPPVTTETPRPPRTIAENNPERDAAALDRLEEVLAQKEKTSIQRLTGLLRGVVARYAGTPAAEQAAELLAEIERARARGQDPKSVLATAAVVREKPPLAVSTAQTSPSPTPTPTPTPAQPPTPTPVPTPSPPANATPAEKAKFVYDQLLNRIQAEKAPPEHAARLLRIFAHEHDGTPAANEARDYARKYKVGQPPPGQRFSELDELQRLTLLDELAGKFQGGDPEAVAAALDEMRNRQVDKIPIRVIAPLFDYANTQPAAKTRAAAVALLGQLDAPQSAAVLHRALDDRNEAVRLAALRGLRGKEEAARGAAAALRRLAHGVGGDGGVVVQPADPSPPVRQEARAVLDQWGLEKQVKRD